MRYAILTEGLLTGTNGKTAHGVLRYRSDAVAAVIDSSYAGKRVDEVLPWLESRAPIVATLDEAMIYAPPPRAGICHRRCGPRCSPPSTPDWKS